jgi:hypothetical protein
MVFFLNFFVLSSNCNCLCCWYVAKISFESVYVSWKWLCCWV